MKRRQFIKTSVSAGLFSIVPRFVLGGTGFTAPSDQLTKAVIGVGGMGRWHALTAPGKLLAVCDVDKNHLKRTQKDAGANVDGYHDFREVLARDDIDIVHIATPPHWHGIMSIMAAKAGKDVWCEKPMTRTIGEGQKVIEAVEQNGTIFRINTWFRFQSNFYGFGTPVKPIKKLVESGLLGWPLKVNININTGFAWKFYWQGKKDLSAQWIPEELDYNAWLGPAPYKPYSKHRVHSSFRGYWDYDGGGLGDMGQHYLDPVQYLLGKDDTGPVEIEVDAEQAHYDAVGTWRHIWMKYKDGCQITLNGDTKKDKIPFLEGPDGKLFRGFKSDIPDLEKKLASLPEPQEQITDFHYAVKKRKPFALNATNGHRSASLVNLGKIALRLGRKLYYDPEKQVFINDEAANRLINQPARSPWIL
ncbi:MAG: gfo/Idh/MocA family oxidoreductase [Calditrichaeota bacterium]|nr:MAG: gfo/Idh/MocA family oxidoreductase [Calditrichota bacterium]MBL1205207.1 gfo/Idh/MocA family oxidoreductase [Calditrichota bacterium]NOG45037.1 Gfo/Idh/MocA family oxidoreductase [Calditrichota bacterium]